MTATARSTPVSPSRYPIEALLSAIGDVPATVEPTVVKRRSRDFFWYSPVLNEQLAQSFGDVVIAPRNEQDVITVAAAAARLRIPVTVRAGATGNYGQCVPLQGGIILDITALDRLISVKPGAMRVEAGAKMHHLDDQLRPLGYEQRLHPSTKRTATIGGFVAGGSGGVGSVTYGGLREPGNILAARVVTLEETPRVIELRADAAQKINRTYGTTGIITELEMPTAMAFPWVDLITAFDDFRDAFQFAREVAFADGIVKKLLTPIIWPIPSYFGPIKAHCPDGKHLVIAMIAEPYVEGFKALLKGRGEITFEGPTEEGSGKVPLYEYTWNHTTLQVLKSDRSVTYLQCLFPPDRLEDSVFQMKEMFEGEVLPHLEFIRFGGRISCSALPVVRYTSKERLDEIIALHEKNGVMIANPHVYTLEDGSRHKWVDADQMEFKHAVDPYGLLNPGKMRTFQPRAV